MIIVALKLFITGFMYMPYIRILSVLDQPTSRRHFSTELVCNRSACSTSHIRKE